MESGDFRHITIEKLGPAKAEELSTLLLAADKEYSRHFIPFEFDRETIETILGQARKDQYFGVYLSGSLAGFYMLRGFDQGYEIPSYGVWIGPGSSGLGLASLTLHHALSFCRANGIKKLMLKVHPENIVAKGIYERNGFNAQGVDDKNNNIIYYKKL